MSTKLSIVSELRDAINNSPEYTVAEVLYSILRPMGSEGQTGKISDILKLTDTEILTRIEVSKEIEHE